MTENQDYYLKDFDIYKNVMFIIRHGKTDVLTLSFRHWKPVSKIVENGSIKKLENSDS